MKKFVCTVCGVGADKFVEQSGDLAFADEHRIGVAKGVDERIIEGLKLTLLVNAQK